MCGADKGNIRPSTRDSIMRHILSKDVGFFRFGERRSGIPVITQDSFRRAVREALSHSPFQAGTRSHLCRASGLVL